MNTTAEVVPFYFQTNEIRTTIIANEPWFVAKDVCDVLGLNNVAMAIAKIPEKDLTSIRLMSGGQNREMNAISEPGLYRLVLRSDKPQAEPFIDWVTAEVRPSIRKTGGYTLPGIPKTAPLFNEEETAVAVARTREGELMLRELRIGIGVARAIGIGGRRRILEEAAQQVMARCGVDPILYFQIDLDRVFPRLSSGQPPALIAEFIAAELEPSETHEERVGLKETYGRYRTWYGEQIDHRLRGLPTLKAMAAKLRAAGLTIEYRGGRTWLTGVRLVGEEVMA
jgi:prophage antirepressor-like protein